LLLFLIFVLALPLFLIAPRSGLAAITRSGGGPAHFVGFSESVSLGEIGELKQDDAVVMRVRVDQNLLARRIRWRGVALDEFTGRGWRKSLEARRGGRNERGERGFFRLATTEALHRLTMQTFFLEPLESPVLFAAHRAVAIQGDLPFVRVDGEGSLQAHRHEFERVIYKVYSDINEPHPEQLRADMRRYPAEYSRYLQLPEIVDPRISVLANAMIINAQARNRYDAARAIESQLQIDYGYSLQMTASGADPLADFLFNVKAGHCEYFSTAMAVMLRTKGIAARVVNGFLPGEYNEAAGAYTVRQSDAHSWVEVYFPETNAWVTFDPTPAAGRAEPMRTGFAAQLQKYGEALELIWFQYVVGYDQQEQRTLATNVHNQISDYGRIFTALFTTLRSALPRTLGSIGLFTFVVLLAVALVFLGKRISRLGWRRGLQFTSRRSAASESAVVFYERLLRLLAQRGWEREKHLTPLEFAGALKSREAILVTRAYNRVRFGNERLSANEAKEIERILLELESTQ
jgi:protein-glutamine gamma-glutamyltransferase